MYVDSTMLSLIECISNETISCGVYSSYSRVRAVIGIILRRGDMS